MTYLDSDVIPRNIHQSLMVNNHFAVGVGPSGNVVGLIDKHEDQGKRLECAFAFHYPDIITKPNLALLRSHHDLMEDSNLVTGHILPWDDEGAAKPIAGCTVSGGVVHIYRIDDALFNVLLRLQEILLSFEPTKPLLGSPHNFTDWYCQLSGKEKSTIHGDLVESFLRLTEAEQRSAIYDTEGNLKQELKYSLNACFGKDGVHDARDILLQILLSFARYR